MQAFFFNLLIVSILKFDEGEFYFNKYIYFFRECFPFKWLECESFSERLGLSPVSSLLPTVLPSLVLFIPRA